MKNTLANNALLSLMGQIVPMFVVIIAIPYIVRGLGENGYGILSIALMVLGYFGFFDLGLGRATIKFVAENTSPDKVHKIPELVWSSIFVIAIIGSIVGIVSALLVPYAISHMFNIPFAYLSQAKISLLIICGSLPLVLVNDALRGVLEGAQRFDIVILIKVPASICFYVLAPAAIFFGMNVAGLIGILISIRLITTCIFLFFCFREFPGLRNSFLITKHSIRSLASFGTWIMVSNVIGPFLGYLERLFIVYFLPVNMLTYYSIPFDLLSKLLIFSASIATVLFPYFSYEGSRRLSAVRDVTARVLKYLLLVMTPLTALSIIFASEILSFWVGHEFSERSTAVMQILAMVFFLNAFAYIPYSSVQALGRPDLKAKLDLVILPMYSLCCWLLLPRYGIEGAAFTKLLSTVIDITVLFIFAWRLKAFSPRDFQSNGLFRTFWAGAGVSAAFLLLHFLHLPLILTLILVAMSCVIYVLTFWFIAVDETDKNALSYLFQRLLNKDKYSLPCS